MSEAPPPIPAEEAMLARLAELDLALAERIHARAMAAAETDELNDLGRTYQRVARSLRQTLALKAKLRREREQPAAPPRRAVADGMADIARIDVRIEQLQDAVGRVIAAASDGEPERREQLFDRFDREMDDWVTDEFFGLQTLDEHVREVCCALDLPEDLTAAWRKLPEPLWTPDPTVVDGPDVAADPPPPLADSG